LSIKTEIALELFGKGFNCAQAVLESHISEFGLLPETSRKIAAAFGAGMGYSDEICGAVSGALMVFGLKYGQFIDGSVDSRKKVYEAARAFIGDFKAEFGSIKCTELVKYNLSVEEELKTARESGVFKAVCPGLIKRAVELVEEIMSPI
jgi:C_GCAxxG_C_C family probable redox protein